MGTRGDPAPVYCSGRAPVGHPTHVLTATPTPKPHQFPAELAQEAVKPSAVHVRAGAPARLASSSLTLGRSVTEWVWLADQRRGHAPRCSRLLALRSSRRSRRPNIWQPARPWRFSQWGLDGLERPRLFSQARVDGSGRPSPTLHPLCGEEKGCI
jgi:hypothetical protein